MRKLTLIIPAKSESETLPIVLKELKKKEFNFIIIMEKSDIETINSIKKFRKYIIFQKNKGYGNAIIKGINSVKTELFCIFNADGSFKSNEIRKMIDLPLVIHGTTGFPEDKINNAIQSGVAMFQVGTIIKETFYNSVTKAIADSSNINNIHNYVGSRKKTDFLEIGKNQIIQLISKYIKLFKSHNKSSYYG